jgi:hypothetical protein
MDEFPVESSNVRGSLAASAGPDKATAGRDGVIREQRNYAMEPDRWNTGLTTPSWRHRDVEMTSFRFGPKGLGEVECTIEWLQQGASGAAASTQ